jgi:hypothetical protein
MRDRSEGQSKLWNGFDFEKQIFDRIYRINKIYAT